MNRQKFIDLHWSAPQIEVIDAAIERIKSHRNNFCCLALSAAIRDKFKHQSAPCSVIDLYHSQFKRFCWTRNGGYAPEWWSSSSPWKSRRLAALRAFRAACIAAANKEQA